MQKIIAVLNDFDKADLILTRAISTASRMNAALEVIFVHEAPLFRMPDFFLSEETHKSREVDKEKIKSEIKERISKLGYDRESAIFVFVDDTADRVSAHARDMSDTLIVSAYHKNISEDMIKICHLPVMILRNDQQESGSIVLPIELDSGTQSCIDFTKGLFEESRIRLLYDHHYLVDEETKREQKASFERLKSENGLDGDYIEEFAWNEADFGEDYETIEKHLIEYIEKGGFDLTVICAHKNNLLYNEAVIISLLHRLKTDFLVYRRHS